MRSDYIEKIINKFLNESETIIVLKGIDISLVFKNLEVNIEKIIENKFIHFQEIIKRNIISYDEYLALYELIFMQYKKIIILENNLYINYFPVQVKISEESIQSLLVHYDREKEGDKYRLNDINELTYIYSNIKQINNEFYITYNKIMSNEKEILVNIFEDKNQEIKFVDFNDVNNCYNLIDEESYVAMISDLNKKKISSLNIRIKNRSLDNIILEKKIKILKNAFNNLENINLGYLTFSDKLQSYNEEYLNILKKYWGYTSFRKIKIYNMDKLNNGEKFVQEISQDRIISNIIEQTENCINGKEYRDIFITASTGAGKSVMFQIPAIYLAEKYELFTIVISPLIGLMKDQVENLESRNYKFSRTINSDISPIQKQEIINDIIDKKCHILYLAPESLLSKSDLDQIIGNRTLGLLVVDEAHIVTTWGKQFRPDYWYLGDHLNKVKKSQIKNSNKGIGFVIATFTATAIYGGIENMYDETIQSLNMIDPITYLGYVKRNDININIEKLKTLTGKSEYELDKFDILIDKIDQAMLENKKMLIYFPTVALINRFWEYCGIKNISKYISKYHGQLEGYEKDENYRKFLNNETTIMIATKAFGMGIDVDDIEIVSHFAPTGNVCDYVQEIGRVARNPKLEGEAYYNFMNNDFKHINKLHGLSTIKKYQLIEVIKKVYELHKENIENNMNKSRKITKKRNEMLVDAESFEHIFENPFFNEDDGINKVKTAMLLIQKDFERRFSFSPFYVRPIPLFEIGFFEVNSIIKDCIIKRYGKIIQVLDKHRNIYSINLKKIWEKEFDTRYSFPKFKFMLYTKSEELMFKFKDDIKPALMISINLNDGYIDRFEAYIKGLKKIINKSVREEKFYSVDGENGLVNKFSNEVRINKYRSKIIIDTIISAISVYQRDYNNNIHAKMIVAKSLKSGDIKYRFFNGTVLFFKWLEEGFKNIMENIFDGTLYLVNNSKDRNFKEVLLILGILETLDILVFKVLGGKNSQIYIYINETKTMKSIISQPSKYKNKLLDLINERHEISVEMLKYIFSNDFNNEEIWDLIEDYFLGKIPNIVEKNYKK